ncbi:type II toxin-antitoxin system VapC family toxin [bacterium]|nr:MAG: type II toxin-antitoxin system VapC family toxin [bacterium]
MIVETSAFVAVIFQEAGWEVLYRQMATNDCRMGAHSWVETNIVIVGRLGENGRADAEKLRQAIRLEIVAFSEMEAELAIDGFLLYGKGRHPASLNFGDLMSFGCARRNDEPLLFVGDDFPQTDVVPATL